MWSRGEAGARAIGAWRIGARLGVGRLGERWLGTSEDHVQTRMLVRLARDSMADAAGALRFAHDAACMDHAHHLRPESALIDAAGDLWIVAEYPGASEGVFTLAQLQRTKADEKIGAVECGVGAVHLLSALEAAHGSGASEGSLRIEDVLIDRRGRLLLEFHGLGRFLGSLAGVGGGGVAGDVRDALRIVYELMTGLPVGEPRISAARVLGRRARGWEAWFERGLEGVGFASAREALVGLRGV